MMSEESFRRITRRRNLTREEAARDEEIRRRVQEEFPPVRPISPPASDSISETLRQAIRNSGRSVSEISKDAGVPQDMVDQFLSGRRDISVTTVDRLASVLGLKLTVG